MPRALSQRANQKPSRPASKATAMRSTLRPAFSASSRQRLRSFSNALSSIASFFNGWRSTPGTMPATSQLDKLISITAISVVSCFRTIRDWLRSFGVCMGAPSVHISDDGAISSPPPHSIFFGALHALTIDDGGGGTRFSFRLVAAFDVKRMMNAIQHAIALPPNEIVVHRAARRKILRKIAPLATGTQDVHHAVHHRTHLGAALAPARLCRRNERFDVRPFIVRQVARVPQVITIVFRSVLIRPHPWSPSESDHL